MRVLPRCALDPRTKLAVLLVVSTVLLTSGDSLCETAARTAMVALPFVFLLVSGRAALAIGLSALYAASLLFSCVSAFVPSAVALFITANCYVLGRFLPTIATAYFIMSTTTVSEFMAGMGRLRVPMFLTIPLSVLFRFFPTLAEEARAIGAALRMRGITFRSSGPVAMVEYRLVPLMACAVSIGEDLSASALTRGLGSPLPRTETCDIGFSLADAAVALLCVAALAVLSAGLVGVDLP